jgi:hypothetical protein
LEKTATTYKKENIFKKNHSPIVYDKISPFRSNRRRSLEKNNFRIDPMLFTVLNAGMFRSHLKNNAKYPFP